jgi:hypothetical protein
VPASRGVFDKETTHPIVSQPRLAANLPLWHCGSTLEQQCLRRTQGEYTSHAMRLYSVPSGSRLNRRPSVRLRKRFPLLIRAMDHHVLE